MCERQKDINNFGCLSYDQQQAQTERMNQLACTSPNSTVTETLKDEPNDVTELHSDHNSCVAFTPNCQSERTLASKFTDECGEIPQHQTEKASLLDPRATYNASDQCGRNDNTGSDSDRSLNLSAAKLPEELPIHGTCAEVILQHKPFELSTDDSHIQRDKKEDHLELVAATENTDSQLVLSHQEDKNRTCMISKSASMSQTNKDEALESQALSSDTCTKPQNVATTEANKVNKARGNKDVTKTSVDMKAQVSLSTTVELLPVDSSNIANLSGSFHSEKPAHCYSTGILSMEAVNQEDFDSSLSYAMASNEKPLSKLGTPVTNAMTECTVSTSTLNPSTEINGEIQIGFGQPHRTISCQQDAEDNFGSISEVSMFNSDTNNKQTDLTPKKNPSIKPPLGKALAACDVNVHLETNSDIVSIRGNKVSPCSIGGEMVADTSIIEPGHQIPCQKQKQTCRKVTTESSFNAFKEEPKSLEVSPYGVSTLEPVQSTATKNSKERLAKEQGKPHHILLTTGVVSTSKLPLVEKKTAKNNEKSRSSKDMRCDEEMMTKSRQTYKAQCFDQNDDHHSASVQESSTVRDQHDNGPCRMSSFKSRIECSEFQSYDQEKGCLKQESPYCTAKAASTICTSTTSTTLIGSPQSLKGQQFQSLSSSHTKPKEDTQTSEKTSFSGERSEMEFDMDALFSIMHNFSTGAKAPTVHEMCAHDDDKRNSYCTSSPTPFIDNDVNIDRNADHIKSESQSKYLDWQNDYSNENKSSSQEVTTLSVCSISMSTPNLTEIDSNDESKKDDIIPKYNTPKFDTEQTPCGSEMDLQAKAELTSCLNNSNSRTNTSSDNSRCIPKNSPTQPVTKENLPANDSDPACHAKKSTICEVERANSFDVKSDNKPPIFPLLVRVGTLATREMKLKSYIKRMKIDKCKPGTTSLHLACVKGLLEAVKVLIVEFGFDPHVPDTDYQATPLHHAAQNGHTDIIKYLIVVRTCNSEVKDMNGLTPLHYATRKGQLEAVKSLYNDHKCDPEAKDNQQQTALHYSCRFGHKSILEFLIMRKGCNPEVSDIEMKTPLHFACEYRYKDIVLYLVSKKKCNTNAQDFYGRTPLHYSCIWWKRVPYNDDKKLGGDIVEVLLSDPKCDVDKRTKDGNSALHLACITDRLDTVSRLLSKPGCNPNGRNNNGQTPLQLTSHLEVIAELVSKGANPMLSVLYKWQKQHDLKTPYTCLNSWSTEEIRELTRSGLNPMELFTWLMEEITEERALEAIQSIIDNINTSLKFNTCFRNGFNVLHLACKANRANIVECLLVKGGCDPNTKSSSGRTPLQLSSNLSVVKCLLQNQANPTEYLRSLMYEKEENIVLDTMKILTENAKWQMDIALIQACEADLPKVVQFLLKEKNCKPNSVNRAKHSPLQLTSNPDIIKLLLQYGANPVDVYKFHGNILGAKHPPCPSVKVFIVGNPSVGKSSLVAALQDEPSIEILSRPKKVSGVDEKTAGVIPYEFQSKKYGRITLYDFAGQRQFYGSHAALLCNAIQSSPPIFLLVVKLNEDNERIKQNIIYWLSFIENQCMSVTSKPHIIIIGSHADILLKNKEDPYEKRQVVNAAVEAQLKNMKFVEFIAMNCSYTNTSDMKALRSCMKKSTHLVRSHVQSMRFAVHCFQVYLHDKFREEVAIHLKGIQEQVKIDCGRKHIPEATFMPFVPTNIKDLCEFCKELSDQGHILFLNNPLKIEDGWIIIDKSTLLSEVTGSIFAPASFKEHVNLASSTGVVPFSKIKNEFSSYDPEMIIGYLSHLEFCHEVSDSRILHLLDNTCSEDERHFFFSGLVNLKVPDDVWKPKPQQFGYHCGWMLQCKKQGGFFIPRFVEVLLLRLAFDLALAKSPDEVDVTLPSIQRECSIWTTGIFWGSKCGPQVLVEICENQTVIVLMRCEDIHLTECIKYRPKILKAVFQCAREFCHTVQTQEFFLDPSEVTEYGLLKKSLTKLTKYPVEKIANICIDTTSDLKTSIVLQTGTISLQHLLKLEPYAVLQRHHLQMLLQEGSRKVSDLVLREMSVCGCENDIFIKIFDPRPHVQNSQENLYKALKDWCNKCEGTYYNLQQRLSQFSIFAGREADIFEMARITDTEENNSEAPTQPLDPNAYYAINPGIPNVTLSDLAENSTSKADVSYSLLDIDDKPSLRDLRVLHGREEKSLRIIDTVASEWEELAIALGFNQSVIAYVRKDYDHDSIGATYKILNMWLNNDKENMYENLRDPITWSALLECLCDIGFSTIAEEVRELFDMSRSAVLLSMDL